MHYGITGCVEKNGTGIEGGVLLSQADTADKVANTNDGCFSFSEFTPGAQISISLDEAGVSGRPFIQLNETTPGSTDVIMLQGDSPYLESNYGFTVTDAEDDNNVLHGEVTTSGNVIDNPELIDTSILNETGYIIEYLSLIHI